MSISGSHDRLSVTGVEILKQIDTTSSPNIQSFALNPRNGLVFPRLAGLSMQYERYRFSNLRACYRTACPATRSGLVAIAVHTDYSNSFQVPFDVPQFASFEYSSVGTVASDLSTPAWRNTDPKYFYLDETKDGGSLNINQGSVHVLTRDALASDAYAIGGYLELHYTVEFFTARPTDCRDVVLRGVDPQSNPAAINTGTNTTAALFVPLGSGQNVGFKPASVGYFSLPTFYDAFDDTDLKASPFFGVSDVDQESTVNDSIPAGLWHFKSSSAYGPEVSASSLTVPIRKSDVPRDGTQAPPLRFYNPLFIIDPPGWWTPVPPELCTYNPAEFKNHTDWRAAIGAHVRRLRGGTPSAPTREFTNNLEFVSERDPTTLQLITGDLVTPGEGKGLTTTLDAEVILTQAGRIFEYAYPSNTGFKRARATETDGEDVFTSAFRVLTWIGDIASLFA